MALVTKEDLDAFETRLGVQLLAFADRLDCMEQQVEGILALMQNHGTTLGELHALLPKLIGHSRTSRHSTGPSSPPPQPCAEVP